ncbi:MAG: hypothetical protein E6R05_04485 [Candidatus Moraniibacteriota bacterium]|nr:MAG: hypothetical protein E6R05_04485 [Candidatus Moranbacteria bacterium]
MYLKNTTLLVVGMALAPSIALAGVISDAKPLSESLTDILDFLLLIFGVIAILGMIVAGVLYFTAGGDERQVMVAKRAFTWCVVGIVVTLGSQVLVRALAAFFG